MTVVRSVMRGVTTAFRSARKEERIDVMSLEAGGGGM